MKRINTAFHNNGKHAFNDRSPIERSIIMRMIAERHERLRRPEVVGDFVVMLGEMVKEPVVEGNYLVVDTCVDTQVIVQVFQDNYTWFVLPMGSVRRIPMDSFDQQYYRWVLIHKLDENVLNELKRRK